MCGRVHVSIKQPRVNKVDILRGFLPFTRCVISECKTNAASIMNIQDTGDSQAAGPFDRLKGKAFVIMESKYACAHNCVFKDISRGRENWYVGRDR